MQLNGRLRLTEVGRLSVWWLVFETMVIVDECAGNLVLSAFLVRVACLYHQFTSVFAAEQFSECGGSILKSVGDV